MISSYRYRLIPDKKQNQLLDQWEGSTRWLWNYFLDMNRKQYETDKTFIWKYNLSKQIPILKQQYPWLKQVPAHALLNVAFDLDRALTRATRTKDQGFPKFKCKGRNSGALTINQVNNHIKITDNHIIIPKIGNVKWNYHRPITGKIKQISITKDVNHWFVSVVCEVSDVEKVKIDKQKVIGIDLGISSFAICSDGTKIESPTFLKKRARYLKRYQRQLSKKQKGSNNRKKAVTRVAKTHQKIRNQRADWLHKQSNDLTNKYDLICLEDLKTKDLMTGKKQRSLNKAISDQGWGIFISQLKYKAEKKGKHVVQIDQFDPSSKTCHCCGHKMSKMALDIRNWTCPECNTAHDRDINAALNIKFWGMMLVDHASYLQENTGGTPEIHACGDTIIRDNIFYHEVSLNQEEAAASLGQQ